MIERCLAKSPADRYSSTRDLARELRGIKDHLSELSSERVSGGSAAPRRRRDADSSPARRRRALAAAAGIWIGVVRRARVGRRSPELKRLTFRSGSVARALFVPRSNSILYTASWDGQPVGSYLTLPESKGADRKLDAPVQLPMAYTADGSEVLVLLGRPTRGAERVRPARLVAGARRQAAAGARAGGLVRLGARTGGFSPRCACGEGSGSWRRWTRTGGNAKTLFSTAGAISWVRISPDEKRIAFIHHPSRFDNAGEVRVVGVDGSGGRAVSPRYETCTGLAWNARTGDVWFTATADSVYSTSLWAARPGGTAETDLLVPGRARPAGRVGRRLPPRRRIRGHRASSSGSGIGRPSNLSWLGSTYVTDISHDRKNVLFIDGTAEEKTLGTWIRPLNGGEAVRVADGEVGSFSPDDQSIVTTTPGGQGNSPGRARHARDGPVGAAHELDGSQLLPSFAGPDTVLFSRADGGKDEIWRTGIAASGESAGSPRVATARPRIAAGSAFLCIGGNAGRRSLRRSDPVRRRGGAPHGPRARRTAESSSTRGGTRTETRSSR